MKAIKKSIAITLLTILFLSSCSKDDAPPTISANDLITTIDENPENGASIGTIMTNISGTFSIVSQTPNGAFAINSQTGEVTVANSSLFDFETNPNPQAIVVATGSGTESLANVDVTLNNVDDIASFLTTSSAAYTATAAGDWIVITEDEYNALATNLNQVSKVGTSDADLASEITTGSGASNYTVGNNNGETIPNGSYVFAFKYESYGDGGSNSKVKISSPDVTGTYSNLGNILPVHESGFQYFVLKGNQTALTDIGHLAFFEATGIGYSNTAVSSYFATSGDVDTVVISTGLMIMYQGLSTTQKQWD